MTDSIPAARTRPANVSPAQGHVVFVHGTLDDSGSFRRVLDRLGAWHVTSYDRRGWGRAATLPPADVIDHARDLLSVLPDEPSVLCGHSFGATVALTAAASAPGRIRAVIAYEPPLPWLPWWPDRAPWEQLVLDEGRDPGDAAEALLRAVLGDAGWEHLPARVRHERRGGGRALVEEMRLGETPPTFDPLTLITPVITAAGSESLPHHILVAARLAELLPHGQYHELATAGHPAHATHPDQFAALIGAASEFAQLRT